MKKLELLSPAGDMERLKMSVLYGADAVYLAGTDFGMRSFAGNFTPEELPKAVEFAHSHGVNVHVTVNTMPRNDEVAKLPAYLEQLQEAKVDALILADLGAFTLAGKYAPNCARHISTQQSVANYECATAWYELGATRVVLARELSLDEIRTVREKTPKELELETFGHGAMCVSYSGRCLLSNYMTERDSNQGQCAQACRWNYNLVEEKRPNEFYPIQEDERGTYVFNSQDLCLLPHLKDLVDAGIASFKIEGRMKSAYYVATIIRAYRNMIDACFEGAAVSDDIHFWLDELQKVSHRPYTTGFYYGKPEKGALTLDDSQYIRPYDFIGVVHNYDEATGIATIEQRNHFRVGDTVEFFSPQYGFFQQEITEMWDKNGEPITVAPHAQQMVRIPVVHPVYDMDLMRKQVGDSKK